ncbi:MAG: NADH-quinone oxidoreductase subunit F [Rhodospirillaceae bacterium]|jgi:formate dehydrogenase beta subunit|nr:NADH-quinone oxidoreductase subunit F [Rhodospirillaceae bacterium]MBT5666537.1 NADH-quinone oxidoreductase subunit F [Rhodospirillaceae bacterium]
MTEAASTPTKRRHPGKGRRRARSTPKGRQIDHAALETVQALLGDRPRDRDLLIEHLHLIQDAHHCLSAPHLVALAHEMRLPLSEVYEVASFYAHFDIVKEDDPALPALTIRVCDSLSCALAGGQKLRSDLIAKYGGDVRVLPAPCMGRCEAAPAAEVGHRHVGPATIEAVDAVVQSGDTSPKPIDYKGLEAYHAGGGYALLKACLAGEKSADDVIAVMEESSLRGLGGAGFPTGRKWGLVRAEAKPRYMAVNADEGEPGTFKDRTYLEQDPHRFLEGMLVAAWAVEAERIYIYLRDEYPHIREILQAELTKLKSDGLASHTDIIMRRGAGAYICGEESAMIESIEGKRGLPRHRPPYVAQVGLFDRPTLVNNVETLFWVRDIIEKGAAWFSSEGRNGGVGMRSFSVSGRVRDPGVKFAPAGITVRELIDEYCGGMADGHEFKGYLPGGASGGILPASKGDLPLEFGKLEEFGCFVGSHAVVILSNHDNMRDVALNLMRFFEDESCGQCTPCRVGTEKAVKLMEQPNWDTGLLEELGNAMADASICGLGQAAANPVFSVLRHFPEDVT